MKFKESSFANIYYVYEGGELIGMQENHRYYFVGDIVRVTTDTHGYICPGIDRPGIGMIVDIHEDDTDYFYVVKMTDGQSGDCKSARLQILSNLQLTAGTRGMLEHTRNECARRR